MAKSKKSIVAVKATPTEKLSISKPSVSFPRYSLREALIIPQAITDNFAGDPTSPLQIAIALDKSPTSSSWRYLAGAAIAYGLTEGSYNASKIALTDLGRRATAPTVDGDDTLAKAEAALKPTVFGGFFSKYNRSKFPSEKIAGNVLMQEFGVAANKVKDALRIILDNGQFAGFIHSTKGGDMVSTDDLRPSPVIPLAEADNYPEQGLALPSDAADAGQDLVAVGSKAQAVFKVFISHGKNLSIVDQVKDVLELYDIEYEIAVEEESTAIPVSEKVLGAMRRCNAGIMIVSSEAASETAAINNNVLIEIGAAFVLYDQKVVLLWDTQLKVPSNLQGLYRCEFEGSQLSFEAGTKLAKAIKQFKR